MDEMPDDYDYLGNGQEYDDLINERPCKETRELIHRLQLLYPAFSLAKILNISPEVSHVVWARREED